MTMIGVSKLQYMTSHIYLIFSLSGAVVNPGNLEELLITTILKDSKTIGYKSHRNEWCSWTNLQTKL